jgi:tetratricopeptide (TPR) repeat protein
MACTWCCAVVLGLWGLSAQGAEGLTVRVPVYEEPAENAFDHYQQAFDLLPAERQWDTLAIELDEADLADVETTVLFAQEALDELRQGIGKPCVMPGQLDFSSLLPYLADFRSTTRLLMVEAWMYVQLGQFDAAFKAYRDAMTLGQDSARNGLIIHKLMSIACEAIACSHIRDTARLEEAEDEALAELLEFLKGFEAEEVPVAEALAVEYDTARRSLERLEGKPDEFRALVGADDGPRITPQMIDGALPELATYYAQMIAISKTDYWRWTNEDLRPPGGNKVLEMIVPALGGLRKKVTHHQADLRGTLLVVALEVYFAKNGAYPEQLAELAPDILDEVPLDPFCGEPFRYNLVDALTYTLYSVGENRTDDGGQEETKRGARDRDMVFSNMK